MFSSVILNLVIIIEDISDPLGLASFVCILYRGPSDECTVDSMCRASCQFRFVCVLHCGNRSATYLSEMYGGDDEGFIQLNMTCIVYVQ